MTNRPMYRIVLIALLTILAVCAIACGAIAQEKESAAFRSPDALVLVLSGQLLYDKVNINYVSVVPKADVIKDLELLNRQFLWTVNDYIISNKPIGTEGGKDSTSVEFDTQRLTLPDGTLQLEPLITALKRFRNIRIIYLTTKSYKFNGLKNYENDYVKISFQKGGNALTYDVVVKDSDFVRLNLPKRIDTSNKPARGGLSPAARVVFIVLGAAAGAAFIYLIVALILRRRANG